MSESIDPRWSDVLSLIVHEFRTPLSTGSGYVGMLLKPRAGALTDQQRFMLEAAAKSCGRLGTLVAEVSDLSNLEAGTLKFNRHETDLRAAIAAAASQLPPLPDREVSEVRIDVQLQPGPALVQGDPVRLTQAFSAILMAVRREIVTAASLGVREVTPPGESAFEFHIGDDETLAALAADPARPIFDEWRFGVGLSLLIARRILDAHGGQLWGPPGGRKLGARVLIPAV